MVDSNFTDDLDDDMEEGQEAEHPADPATVPQSEKKPDTVLVDLTLEERANAALRACEKWDEIQVIKEQVGKLNTRKKVLEKEHMILAKQGITGKAEVAVDQVDMFRRPKGEAVGTDTAAKTFDQLAKDAEAANAAAEAETPSWKPEQHAADCPAKQGPLHPCAASCSWNKAHGGPVAEEPFEASEVELGAQAGRKKGKRAA